MDYDYIVIGSGILGLSTACELKESDPGKEVLVIEQGIFPTGASTKNAGFLCFGSLTEILSDIDLKSEVKAVELIEKRWKGINLLTKRLALNKIGYYNFGGYELIDSRNISAIEKIDNVNNLLNDIFPDKVFTLKNDLIKEFGFNSELVAALVYSPFESQIDTGELMKTLLKYTKFLGIEIINGCEVKKIEDDNNTKVICENGSMKEEIIFTAKKVFVCANAFMQKLLPNPEVRPGRGHVLITKPIKGLKIKGVFHYDEGYYYFRNYENRIIFGGGRNLDFKKEETTEFDFNEKILMDLENKLKDMIIPGIDYEIEHKWIGIMGFTEDKLPFITKHSNNVIAANGCNGMGMALSSYLAKEIVKTIKPD